MQVMALVGNVAGRANGQLGAVPRRIQRPVDVTDAPPADGIAFTQHAQLDVYWSRVSDEGTTVTMIRCHAGSDLHRLACYSLCCFLRPETEPIVTIEHLHVKDRFGRQLERRDGRDFPFYNREPIEVATWKWLVIIAACAIALVVLTSIPQPNNFVGLLPRILFPVIMLAVFILLTGQFWKSIFRKLTGWDLLNMVFFAVLNTVVALIVGGIIRTISGTTANAATQGLAELSPGELVSFYLGTGAQLFGEELFTVLPFLAIMYWLYTKAYLGRKTAIILAWLITAIWFGAAHLPTYDWNALQALVGIGVARLVLTLAFIRTKNILVSTGAHILNDWGGFTFALLIGLAATGSAH